MKILHVITSLRTGGAEKLMVDLLPRIASHGHEVELAVFSGEETPFLTMLQDKGITVHRFSETPRNVYSPANLSKLVTLIRGKGYDIVHTHNTSPQLFAAVASLVSKPVFVTTEHNTSNRRRNKPWLKPFDRWLYSRYSSIICISEEALVALRDYLGTKDKYTLINNGVEIDTFLSEPKDISKKDKFIITMVAAFRPQKDQDTIIRALTHLPESFSLRLAGEGPRRAELEKLAQDLGVGSRVEFLGVRSDVAQVLRESDFVVMSSHYEGLSLSSVEGMASGRPFLASDVPGLHQVVDGAGVLFPQSDDKALASALQRLASDPTEYRAVVDRCQSRARQFDISSTADGYCRLYEQLALSR